MRVLAAVPVALALAVAAGCGGSGGGNAAGTTATRATTPTSTSSIDLGSVQTHGRYHYSRAVVRSYMASCTAGRASRIAYCGCTLDKLSNNVSMQQFARIGRSGGLMPKKIRLLITRAAAECRGKH